MKQFRIYLIALIAVCCAVSCSSNKPVDAPFDSKLYMNTATKVEKIALKANVSGAVKTIQSAVPKPAVADVEIVYNDDAALVKTYNEAFYDDAQMLPAENYELLSRKAVLKQGAILSSEIEVVFKELDLLSRAVTYVLPVTIASAGNMPVLESARTRYYVLKALPSIEVVPDMEKKNYIYFPSFEASKPSGEACNNMAQFTFEALVRIRKFEPGIQTVMGVEGDFLLRVSDSGLAPEQLQFATPFGNLSSDQCKLTPNKWTHIAAIYDMTAAVVRIYVDGVEVATKTELRGAQPASFGKPVRPVGGLGDPRPFYIGFSYQSGRELNGEICECRIWNVVRTQEQIANNVYEVEPDSPGLVAYWKFNDGQGKGIKDYTSNHNDGVASDVLRWTAVSLPEIE